MRVNLVPYCPPEQPLSIEAQPADPFMNNMDEISFWIYTKQAPCLLNFENVIKKQIEQAQCSKTKPASVQSAVEEVPSSKKKKRKLKLLDDDSVSSEKQQNVYFETSKCDNQKIAPTNCKSEEIASNVDFDINNSSQQTAKRIKLQRNCQTSQRKSKLVTSTPKVTNLRRSLRKTQQNNNNIQHNSSYEINDTSGVNGKLENEKGEQDKHDKLLNTNHTEQAKTEIDKDNKNAVVLNGQFDDLSDVSGFTANYIRSTKIHSKTPRKLRNRNSRNLIKDTKQNDTADDEMLVCVNKSVNTQPPDNTALNCSTDSSQNIINLVSGKNNGRSTRINKSTSPLKFMESRAERANTSNNRNNKNDLKISFQSKSSGSRYPRRKRNVTIVDSEPDCSKNNRSPINSPVTRHSARRTRLNNCDKKDNSQDKIKPKTRNGRKSGLKMDQEESGCSMVQLNNSSDPVSSSLGLNVASPKKRVKKSSSKGRRLRSRRHRDKTGDKDSVSDKSDKIIQDNAKETGVHSTTPHCVRRVKKSLNKTGHSSRDSLRDKSGFAACFSDSDSEPLKRRKFFC